VMRTPILLLPCLLPSYVAPGTNAVTV
jgi:hypothetical protein